MHKHTVTVVDQRNGKESNIEVSLFDTLKEANDKLGEKGALEMLNSKVTSDARAIEHRKGQLDNNKKRRALSAAAMAFAKEKGWDPAKVKIG